MELVTERRRERLAREIDKAIRRASDTAMVWGRNDCALWCANIVRAALYYDPAHSFRRKYRSGSGAARLLGKRGLLKALQRTAEDWGWRECPPLDCEPGDVGLVKTPQGLACVICFTSGLWVGRVDFGWTLIKDDGNNIVRSWKVC